MTDKEDIYPKYKVTTNDSEDHPYRVWTMENGLGYRGWELLTSHRYLWTAKREAKKLAEKSVRNHMRTKAYQYKELWGPEP